MMAQTLIKGDRRAGQRIDDLALAIPAFVLCGLCVLAWLAAIVLLPLRDYLVAAVLMLAVVLPPIALFALLRVASGARWAVLLIVFAVVFLSDSTLRAKAAGDTGIDAQSLIKLSVWLSGIVLIPWAAGMIRQALHTKAIAFLIAFGVWAAFGTVYSITPGYTFAAGASFCGICVLAVVAGERLSSTDGLQWVLIALFAGLSVSFLMYIFVPDRAFSPMEGGRILRLSGLFGSPNNLGRASALALMLVVIYWLYGSRRASLLITVAVVPVAMACLLLSGSRTSIFGLCAGIGIVFVRKAPAVTFAIAGLLLASALVFLFSPLRLDDVMLLFSRSGRASELTTFTGRTDIWAWVLTAINQNPILGYGFASTRELIPSGYFAAYGWTTTSAHNLWLQAWVTTGLIGLTLIVASQLATIYDAFRHPDPLRDSVFVFICIIGLAEAGPVGPSVNLLTFVWVWAIATAASQRNRAR